MTSTARADANRRNAQRSTGPKSPEGKARASMNALKHGLTAEFAVLPDEDPEKFDALVRQWTEFYATDDPAAMAMIERAVSSKWKLDRCTRAETARIAQRVRDARWRHDTRTRETADTVGLKLVFHPLDTLDAGHPAALLDQMEDSARGVDWLIGQWVELGEILDEHGTWADWQQKSALRLLGRRIESAACDPVVRRVIGACQAAAAGPGGDPADRAAGLTILRAMVDLESSRLRGMCGRLGAVDDAARQNAAERAMFDDGEEAAVLRRYETACERELHRAIHDLQALRRDAIQAPPAPASAPDPAPVRNEAIAEDKGDKEVKKSTPSSPPAPPRVNGPSVPVSDADAVGTAVSGPKTALLNAV